MKPYSIDLREKIISVYEAGNTSIRKVAERFKVSKNTVQNLVKRKREKGTLEPSVATGGKPSQLSGYEQQIEEMVAEHLDYTLAEYCEYWEEKTGVRLSESAMCRFLQKQKLTLKKNSTKQSSRDRNYTKKRLDYWESIRDVLADDLVFVDEMGVLLGLMRGMGRSKKGDRVYDVKPFYRGSRVTVVGAISNKSILALKTLGQSMNGEDFKKFVEEELLPKLWKGAVVVMDNLKAHKMKGIIEMIESVGARVVYLSPYSPEFNPIEHLWWQLKALIRKFSPKNSLTVVQLLSVGVLLCSSQQLQNYFSAATVPVSRAKCCIISHI